MTCKEVHKKMNSYLSEELATEQLQAFELHLKDCASCGYLISEVKKTVSLIDKTKKISADPFMFTRIQAQIENRDVVTSRSWQKIIQPVALAIIMGVGLYSGISVGTKYYNESFQLNEEASEIGYQDDDDLYLNVLAYESIESFLLTEN